MNHEDFKKAIDLNPNTKFKFDLDKVAYSFMTYPNVTGIVTFVAWLHNGYFLGAVEGYFEGLSFKPEEVELYKEDEEGGWIAWGGSSEAPVPKGTKVDVKYHDGSVAIGIGYGDQSSVEGCKYGLYSWYRITNRPVNSSVVAYRIHKPSVASQEAITERLEDSPSVSIDYSVMGSMAPTELTYKVGDPVVVTDLEVFNVCFVKVGDTATVIEILPNGDLWLNCSSWQYKQICNPHNVKPVGVAQSEVKEIPLITITQEVKYTVVIKGREFTFTQEELDALAEELLEFTTL